MLTLQVYKGAGQKSEVKKSLLGGSPKRKMEGSSIMSSSSKSKFVSRRNLFKPIVKHVEVTDFKFE